ncbi:MAG: helix-turn-helix transcriptional regulator [Streptosporangiales bacterium]|nr:helix-turn-helix transcriptional regulator [Streptosporangiales bacterium]MBO0890694.1 helix-turn-helix transcriptional regulator [Acidothermales bacterium]
MTSVFGHGRLRLYLLKLLDEEPRHGYDMIRLLEDRFMGVYAPSAGTIYPRLNRLEEEGLVSHEVVEGKKVYRLTDAGRAELAERSDEIEALEQDIDRSVRDLAREVREDVRSSVRNLREELKAAAREVRDADREGRDDHRRPWDEIGDIPGWAETKEAMSKAFKESSKAWRTEWEHGFGGEGKTAKRVVRELVRNTELLRDEVRRAVKTHADETALREANTTIESTLARLRGLFR